MNKKFSCLFFLLVICHLIQAQGVVSMSDTLFFAAGKLFYKHIVQKKQTLYSISKSYGVKIDDILRTNNLQNKDIKEGQNLLIPAVISPPKGSVLIAGDNIYLVDYYTVKKGDTYYKIAKQHNISVQFLEALNPDVSENALKDGQVLLTPRYVKSTKQTEKAQQQNEVIFHEVSQGETLFSIARKYQTTVDEIKKLNPEIDAQIRIGQKIKVPLGNQKTTQTQDKCKCTKVHHPVKFKITILLPLPSKPFSYPIPKENEDWEKPAEFEYVEFYQGFRLALDSFSSFDNSCTIKVLTLGNDTLNLLEILKEKSVDKSDLVISLLNHEQNDKILENDYLKNTFFVVCHVDRNETLAENNSHLIQFLTPINLQFEALLSYLDSNHNQSNIIFAYKGDENIVEIGKLFQELAQQSLIPITTVNLNQMHNSAVFSKLNSQKENVVILMANNEFFVKEFLRQMFESYNKYQIVVFGLPTWLDFEFVEFDIMEKFNIHFFSSQFIDYNQYEVNSFVKKFQDMFGADPGRKAFLGYDMAIFFTKIMKEYGECYFDCMDKINESKLLSTSFNFIRVGKGGWVNSSVQFYEMKNFYLWKK
ncbi:MAG: LysM peptidoglycan-binding domain-containing protein [Bacteroidales bacterium]|nr:LysM peptidoglycan-binding domain-containing protein [Bacteroidales bacterium]